MTNPLAITFKHAFQIRGFDRLLPAGSYEVITDEEMIKGLSFASFRRVATMIVACGRVVRLGGGDDLDRIGRSVGRALIDGNAPND